VSRTIVYIDGFNLYYRALRGTAYKWLDVAELSAAALPASSRIERVNYYTARVSGRIDPATPARQHAYLRALESLAPQVAIHYGNFMTTKSGPDWCSRLTLSRLSRYRRVRLPMLPMSGIPKKKDRT
jgi:hypothetical protein